MSIDALHRLAVERGVAWDALAEDLSDLYEWQISIMALNVRFRVALREVHEDPDAAYRDACSLRDDALTAGFRLNSRCEVSVVASTSADGQVIHWRGLVDLGLLPASNDE